LGIADELRRLLESVAITTAWNADCQETRNDAI
jgi:hypothetical protein